MLAARRACCVVRRNQQDGGPAFDIFTCQALPPEDEALRRAFRAQAKAAAAPLSADGRARSWQGFDAAFSRKLGEAGFLGLTLPRDYGGGGRGPFARFVVVEEPQIGRAAWRERVCEYG